MSSESTITSNSSVENNCHTEPAPVQPTTNRRCKLTPKNVVQRSEGLMPLKVTKRRNTVAGEDVQAKKKQKSTNSASGVEVGDHRSVLAGEEDNCRGSFLFDGVAVVCEKRVKMKRNLKLCTIVSGLSLQTLPHLSPKLSDNYTTFLGPKDGPSADIYIQIHFHQDTLIEQGDTLAYFCAYD